MREYLIHFFDEFSYAKRDAKVLLSAYDTITSDEEAKKVWNTLMSAYRENIHCDYDRLRSDIRLAAERLKLHSYTAELLLFIGLSRYMREKYIEKGLPEEIFRNTIPDLRYKLEECREVYGICGSFVGDWFPGFFRLSRFALGRLQFELVPFQNVYHKNGHKLQEDSLVMNIHIPRTGTPLDTVRCDNSFRQAAAFFRKELEGKEKAFVCHSWLLYPAHREFLPAHSNLLAFMNRFDIFSQGEFGENHPDLWRLFDRMYTGDPGTLAYDTSLRKAYVDRLRMGGKTGWGYGVFFYSDI